MEETILQELYKQRNSLKAQQVYITQLENLLGNKEGSCTKALEKLKGEYIRNLASYKDALSEGRF